ncbi:uncharacterized protein V1516DRAFT_619094 [Lipomyces oligophaga]|uniref:uncharacterized protein n=1 Tax=Lipomyces oligophaga TaxID=45792 RepID=UPI0034CDD9E1
MRFPLLLFGSNELSHNNGDNEDQITTRPPTPEGNKDPILLPNEVVLQVFPKKLCSYRAVPEPKSGGLFSSGEDPEFFHSFLTKKGRLCALWVTTIRLICVPVSSDTKGFSVGVLDIDSMKTIESDCQIWFFYAKLKEGHMFTVPFSTELRTKAFLKLMANLRFEHHVRQELPPPYRRKSESFYDCPRPSLEALSRTVSPMSDSGIELIIEEAIEEEQQDWIANDKHLPSYAESEDAVERYLIDRGLLREDGTSLMPVDSIERHSSTQDLRRGSESSAAASTSQDELAPTSTSSTSRSGASQYITQETDNPVRRPNEDSENSTAGLNELHRIASRGTIGRTSSNVQP